MITEWPELGGDSMGPEIHHLVEAFEAFPVAPGVSHSWKDQWWDNCGTG